MVFWCPEWLPRMALWDFTRIRGCSQEFRAAWRKHSAPTSVLSFCRSIDQLAELQEEVRTVVRHIASYSAQVVSEMVVLVSWSHESPLHHLRLEPQAFPFFFDAASPDRR